MSYRIEYRRKGEVVLVVPCPKAYDDAREDAYLGLHKFKADSGRILDMAQGGQVLEVISLDEEPSGRNKN